MSEQSRALASLLEERERQDQKWGQQNHPPEIWLVILTEEMGELAKVILDDFFLGGCRRPMAEMRIEAVQVAAMALTMVECIDRQIGR